MAVAYTIFKGDRQKRIQEDLAVLRNGQPYLKQGSSRKMNSVGQDPKSVLFRTR